MAEADMTTTAGRVVLFFACLTAVFNWATRFRTIEGWVAFFERKPYLGTCIKLVRKLGIDPVGAIEVVRDLSRYVAEKKRLSSMLPPPEPEAPPVVIPNDRWRPPLPSIPDKPKDDHG